MSGSRLNYVGSASFFDTAVVSGSYPSYEGETTSSMNRESLYILSSSTTGWGGGEERYGKVIVTLGGPEYIFREGLQPNISASVLSEHNYEYKFFYSSAADAALDHGYVWDTDRRNYSSRSLHRSDIQSLGHDNAYFRLAYLGCLQTKDTTTDKLEPVTITVTSPTTLVTQEPGVSKLQVK